jgi:hypothetical protein
MCILWESLSGCIIGESCDGRRCRRGKFATNWVQNLSTKKYNELNRQHESEVEIPWSAGGRTHG